MRPCTAPQHLQGLGSIPHLHPTSRAAWPLWMLDLTASLVAHVSSGLGGDLLSASGTGGGPGQVLP